MLNNFWIFSKSKLELFLFLVLIFPILPINLYLLLAFCGLLTSIFPNRNLFFASLASFFSFFLSPFPFQNNLLPQFLQNAFLAHEFIFRILILLIFSLLSALLLSYKIKHKPALYLVPIGSLFLCIFGMTSSNVMVLTLSCGLFYVMRSAVWPLIATQLYRADEESAKTTLFQKVMLLVPFWSYGTALPIPLGVPFLLPAQVTTSSGLQKSQRSALKLIVYCIAGIYLLKLMDLFFLGKEFTATIGLDQIRPQYAGVFSKTQQSLAGLPSQLKLALGLAVPVARLILQFAVRFGISIASARLLGFQLHSMFNSPFSSVSFNDFLGRILYHYNVLLLKIFMPLFRSIVPRNISAAARIHICLFLTIALGGFLFHFLRDGYRVIELESISDYTLEYIRCLPYYLSLGLFSTWLSSTRKIKKLAGPIERLIRTLFYFLLYSAIYSINLIINHDGRSWGYFVKIWVKILSI